MKRIGLIAALLLTLSFGCGKDLNLPSVETVDVSNINFSSALVEGNVISQGGSEVLQRGVCWSTSTNPSIGGTRSDNGGGTGTFTSAISNLQSNTTYHVRAYATNVDGTSYGDDFVFTTTAK